MYPRHRIFPGEKDRKNHFMAANSCALQKPSSIDGITDAMERRLRSRKKTHREESAEEGWKEIYCILFPNHIVPSACKLVFSLSVGTALFYCIFPIFANAFLQFHGQNSHTLFFAIFLLIHRLRTASRRSLVGVAGLFRTDQLRRIFPSRTPTRV